MFLRQLNDSKSPGEDGIMVELLKAGGIPTRDSRSHIMLRTKSFSEIITSQIFNYCSLHLSDGISLGCADHVWQSILEISVSSSILTSDLTLQ